MSFWHQVKVRLGLEDDWDDEEYYEDEEYYDDDAEPRPTSARRRRGPGS